MYTKALSSISALCKLLTWFPYFYPEVNMLLKNLSHVCYAHLSTTNSSEAQSKSYIKGLQSRLHSCKNFPVTLQVESCLDSKIFFIFMEVIHMSILPDIPNVNLPCIVNTTFSIIKTLQAFEKRLVDTQPTTLLIIGPNFSNKLDIHDMSKYLMKITNIPFHSNHRRKLITFVDEAVSSSPITNFIFLSYASVYVLSFADMQLIAFAHSWRYYSFPSPKPIILLTASGFS